MITPVINPIHFFLVLTNIRNENVALAHVNSYLFDIEMRLISN